MRPTFRLAAVIMPTWQKWSHFGQLLVGIMPLWRLMQPAGAMEARMQQIDIRRGATICRALQKLEHMVLVLRVIAQEALLARERVVPQ
jgi:hypothetical protein